MKFIIKIIFAGLFMNFGFPEIMFHYNEFSRNGQLIQQIKNLDIDDLRSNLNKIIDKNGDFISENVQPLKYKKSKVLKENYFTESLIKNVDRKSILHESKKHIGIPYSWGEEDPSTGFDCSGFTWYVYKKSINFNLPRGSKQQFSSSTGKLIDFNQLKTGDLMFFSFHGNSIQHVAIFINKDQFIHAPKTGRRISIDRMNKYWIQSFVKGKTYLL